MLFEYFVRVCPHRRRYNYRQFDYVGGLRNYYDSKVWIAHLIILLSYIPTNLMAFLSTFCFDTLEGGPGFGMKYKSDCPMLVYNYSKWYLHLGP